MYATKNTNQEGMGKIVGFPTEYEIWFDLEVFSESQADAIAHILVDYYNQLKTDGKDTDMQSLAYYTTKDPRPTDAGGKRFSVKKVDGKYHLVR